MDKDIRYEKEYESLRNELNENRKYVFERPLIIFTTACIFFDYVSKTDYAMLFPCLIILLLLFNLHFTANRLNSNARIIAYIRLYIEKKQSGNYHWETFLDDYRIKCDKNGLKYYPIIFYFHIVLIIFLLFLEILLYIAQLSECTCNIMFQITMPVSIFLIIGGFIYLFFIWKFISPKHMKIFFEKENKNVSEVLK